MDDDGGIEDLPIADIYLGMDNLGYPTEGKLTFHKKQVFTSMEVLGLHHSSLFQYQIWLLGSIWKPTCCCPYLFV